MENTPVKDLAELANGRNLGVIIDVRPTDFVAGAESGIGAAPTLEESGQFDVYLPDEESQVNFDLGAMIDTSGCVSFSALNCLEILFNRKIARGEISAEQKKFLTDEGYINKETGKVNFSDRFTAKMSGTTKLGNSLGAVGDSIRNHGLVPERDWSWPDMSDLQDTVWTPGNPGVSKYEERFARYYAEIPAAVKAKALRFRDFFGKEAITYQWILVGTPNTAIARDALKRGPYQIAAAVCSPWSSNDGMPPIPACGCNTQHATIIYGSREDGAWKDFDHYKSFRKLLAADYCIQYAVQYYLDLTPKTPQAPASVIGYVYSKNLKYGAVDSSEVRMMQAGLQYAKDKAGKPYMKPGVFGPFGPQTKDALGRFQTDRGITDPDGQGTNFGPKTRTALSTAVAK